MSALSRILFALFLGVATQAAAQFTWTVREINPDQGTVELTGPNGGSGGRINRLARSREGDVVFAASEWGGLFRSRDRGRTWEHLPGHVPHATWDVAVDPRNPQHVFATSFYDGRVASRAGINLSTDGGETWTHAVTGNPPAPGNCAEFAHFREPAAFGISINPDRPNNVVIGKNCGLAISDDAGSTWRWVSPTPFLAAGKVWDVVVHHGGIIDVCGDGGHARSADGGQTWTAADPLVAPLPGGARCSITVSPDEPDVLFAVVGTTLYESDDGGASWPYTSVNPAPQGRIPFVAANPRGEGRFDLWFGDVGLWQTKCVAPGPAPAFKARRCPENSWSGSFASPAGAHDDVGDILFAPGPENDACPTLFASDGGIFRNAAAGEAGCQSPRWEQPETTPHALWLWTMAGTARGETPAIRDLFFGTQDNGLFVTADAGGSSPSWTNLACCDSFDLAVDAARALFTHCCRGGGGPATRIGVVQPGSKLITYVDEPLPGALPGFGYDEVLRRWGDRSYAIATLDAGIFATTDILASPIQWIELGEASSPFFPLSVEVARSGAIPAFFARAFGDVGNRLYRWEHQGDVWREIQPPGGIGGFGVLAIDPRDADRIFAAHLRPPDDPQMILTTDGGAAWKRLEALDRMMTGDGAFRYVNATGLAHGGANAMPIPRGYPQPTLVAFSPENRNVLVAGGADSGVFLSMDGGESWRLLTDPSTPAVSGRPHIPRPRSAVFDHSRASSLNPRFTLFVGSQGRGVWRIDVDDPPLPGGYALPCGRIEGVCPEPEMVAGEIRFLCPDAPPGLDAPYNCLVRDPVLLNCEKKYTCPGCPPGARCPPWYRFHFDGVDPKVWDVAVVHRDGLKVEYDVRAGARGVTIELRPDPKSFEADGLDGYEIVFARTGETRKMRYEFGARVEVIAEP